MDTLSKASPAKRKASETKASSSASKGRAQFTPGNKDWPCFGCEDGCLLKREKVDGTAFCVCDRNVRGDPGSCDVTASILKPNKTYPKSCQVCLIDVGGSPSVGVSTDEKDSNGYPVWNNIHAVWRHCAGAKTSNDHFKNATIATAETSRKICAGFSSAIEGECTGEIVEGDLIVKDWNDPPLHLICSKRLWKQSLEDILASKRNLKELGSTAEKESTQPSAAVPPHLKDF